MHQTEAVGVKCLCSYGRTARKRKRRGLCYGKNRYYNLELKSLLQWSLQHGLIIAHLTPKQFDMSGRGLMATRDVSSGACLMAVPVDTIITYDIVWDFASRAFTERVLGLLSGKEMFALFLLFEAKLGVGSFYSLYIAMLPKNYSTLPYLLSEEVRTLPEIFHEDLAKQLDEIHLCLKNFRACAGTNDGISQTLLSILKDATFEEVRWAYSVLNTRSVYFQPVKSMTSFKCQKMVNFALIPVFDMFNHKPTAKIEGKYNMKRRTYEVWTYEKYRKGEQVFISYGPHSNFELLTQYGFIVPGNFQDSVCVSTLEVRLNLGKTLSDAAFSNHLKVAEKYGARLKKCCCTVDGFDWNFLILAHVLVADEQTCKGNPNALCCGTAPCSVYKLSADVLHYLFGKNASCRKKMAMCVSDSARLVMNYLIEEERLLGSLLESMCYRCSLNF